MQLARKNINVNEHERLSNLTLRHKWKKKEQLVVRKEMNVNEHEKLSNITLKTAIKALFLYFYLCLVCKLLLYASQNQLYLFCTYI